MKSQGILIWIMSGNPVNIISLSFRQVRAKSADPETAFSLIRVFTVAIQFAYFGQIT